MISARIALLTLASCVSSYAATKGPFISLNVGPVFQTGKHTYTNGAGGEGKQTIKSFGGTGGVSLGYLHEPAGSKLIFGGEVYGGITTINAKKDLIITGGTMEGKVNIKPKNFFGVAMIAGMSINPKVILYGLLGYEFSRFSFEYSNLTFQTPTAQKYSKTTKGMAPGAGAMYKLTDSIILGAEYTMNLQGKLVLRKDDTPINGVKRGYEYSGLSHRVTARLIYVF